MCLGKGQPPRRARTAPGRRYRRQMAAAVSGQVRRRPRPGAPRTIADAEVERVVTLTLESTPRDATHWSTRAMAARCGLSQSTALELRKSCTVINCRKHESSNCFNLSRVVLLRHTKLRGACPRPGSSIVWQLSIRSRIRRTAGTAGGTQWDAADRALQRFARSHPANSQEI